ncbi:MAG: tetratricopeptide repeat protein [Verrucomicrobiaceae bacterium]|nr:tetratricopeptide repeat protein [Verrucomicrobiaceae bacterium]
MKTTSNTTRLPVYLLMALALIPWLLYLNTLHFEPVLDDRQYVLMNPLLASGWSFLFPFNFSEFSRSFMTLDISSDFPLNFILRPVTYMTWFINRLIHGQDTAGYRLVNIFLHMMNAIMLWKILRSLLDDESRRTLILTWFIAVLFAVHPMNVESVTYIAQRSETLVTLFGLLAMWYHLQSTTHPNTTGTMPSLVFTLLAMLSKESAVVLPLVLLLINRLWANCDWKLAIKRVRWHLLLTPVLPLLLLATSWAQSSELNLTKTLNITNIGTDPMPWAHYLMSQIYGWLHYLRFLILPVGQSFDHDFPLITTATDERLVGAILFLLLLCGAVWHAANQATGKRGATLKLGVIWFFVFLLPSSSFIPLPDLFAEHRCYFSSIGFFFSVGALLTIVPGKASEGRQELAPSFMATLTALGLAVATIARNDVMRTKASLWADAFAKGSDSSRVWKGLGIAAHEAGDFKLALERFTRATEKSPRDFEAWANVAGLQLHLKRAQDAISTLEKAEAAIGLTAPIAHLRAVAFLRVGRNDEAIQLWQMILSNYPSHRHANLCLGEIYMQLGRPRDSLDCIERASRSGALSKHHQTIRAKAEEKLGLAAR